MAVSVGVMLQQWRSRRSISQLDLAHDVGVSPRHLSCVETGKSQPSQALLDALARKLEIPLRERNSLFLAAGHAPRYSEVAFDDRQLVRIRATIQELLNAHDPFPGVALDRAWNVVLANSSATKLMSLIPDHLHGPPLNMFRASLHPDGLSGHTCNFDEWASYLLDQLRRLVRTTGDDRLTDIEREVSEYETVRILDGPRASGSSRDQHDPQLVVPFEMLLGSSRLSFFTTMTTFGTPRDITLEELTIELFYPSDQLTADMLRAES